QPPPGRDDRPPAGGPRSTRDDGRFVIFRINWGAQDGADPRRILAHVCRRGGVDNKMVGAIDIGRSSSTFGIAVDVAKEFAVRVRARDRRDPHLVIHQDDHNPKHPTRRPARVPQIWSRRPERPPRR
ncbi:MAG: DbpA RNA binding domain-containing protein, partial [Planctomycetota bacterium]